MDEVTPKDVFQANRDRVTPLLARLKAEGIGHMIGGKTVPSISGQTFETKSPVDGAVLASVARGNAEDIDRAATAASLAFKSWRDMPAAMRKKLLHRVADAIEDRADDIAVLECIDTGQALTEHPAVKAIGFVGESSTGSAIMAQGAPTLKRVHFELGGKNPVIVFDDADLDRALDAVVFMIYSLNGERCTSSSRLLVQQGIADKFIEKLTARVKALKVGHPLDPATEIGPLIHERHLAKVCSYFEVAQKDGATIAVGGKPHDGPGGGHYVQPTLVTGAHSKMRVAQEEVFGPFLTVIPFRDENDAIEIANGVQYGLTGYVWTGDMGRALRVADALEAGMIWLNSENVRHLPTPFGGMKSSGIGRDGGDYSFDFYMETKLVSLARGTHKIQKLGI